MRRWLSAGLLAGVLVAVLAGTAFAFDWGGDAPRLLEAYGSAAQRGDLVSRVMGFFGP